MSSFKLKGRFIVKCFDKFNELKWIEEFDNITTDEGLNNVLDVVFNGAAQSTTWYIGLKGTNQTPGASWNAAGIGTQFTEFTSYDETPRQTWVDAGVSAKQMTNSASPAIFTISGSGTVYGAFVINIATKSAITGKLHCISDFAIPRPVVDNDVMQVVYTLTNQDV